MFCFVHTPPPLLEGQETFEDVVVNQSLVLAGGSAFLGLFYPLYRGLGAYIGQTEHLRTSLDPTRYHRSQLKLGGALHASFQILGAGGGFRSLYYGLTPLMLTFPIITIAQSGVSQLVLDMDSEESAGGVWKTWTMALGLAVASDILSAPLRTLHYAMSTTPATDWAARPSMRQILAKHPGLWRAGLVPFATVPAILLLSYGTFPIGKGSAFSLVSQNFDEIETDDLVGPTIGAANLALVCLFTQIMGITGVRMVVDAIRPPESKVPRYNSWIQAAKLQSRSGWRTLCAGVLAGAFLSSGLTSCMSLSALPALFQEMMEDADDSEDD